MKARKATAMTTKEIRKLVREYYWNKPAQATHDERALWMEQAIRAAIARVEIREVK